MYYCLAEERTVIIQLTINKLQFIISKGDTVLLEVKYLKYDFIILVRW